MKPIALTFLLVLLSMIAQAQKGKTDFGYYDLAPARRLSLARFIAFQDGEDTVQPFIMTGAFFERRIYSAHHKTITVFGLASPHMTPNICFTYENGLMKRYSFDELEPVMDELLHFFKHSHSIPANIVREICFYHTDLMKARKRNRERFPFLNTPAKNVVGQVTR